MNIYGSNLIKNTLKFNSYIKAQRTINKISETPQEIIPDYYIDMNDVASFDYVPAVVDRLSKAIILDEPKSELHDFIEFIDQSIVENFTMGICSVFHFGLLLDNLDLFNEEELKGWTDRMKSLFCDFQDDFCYQFSEFFTRTFQTNFFGADGEYFTRFSKEMEFTYLFIFDYEWHTIDNFGPKVMKYFEEFAEEYKGFYEELIREVVNRKQVVVLSA